MFGHFFEPNGMELTDPAWRPDDGDSSDDDQKKNERAKSSAAISTAVETRRISTDLIVIKRVKDIF